MGSLIQPGGEYEVVKDEKDEDVGDRGILHMTDTSHDEYCT